MFNKHQKIRLFSNFNKINEYKTSKYILKKFIERTKHFKGLKIKYFEFKYLSIKNVVNVFRIIPLLLNDLLHFYLEKCRLT